MTNKKAVLSKFLDIKNCKRYDESWDKVVFKFIEMGRGSTAQAQMLVTGCKFVLAAMLMDALVEYGYMAPAELGFKVLITKEEFCEILDNRKTKC